MVFYDSWLAKKLLKTGYGTIMLFGMIFTKIKKEYSKNTEKGQTTLAHNEVHVQQYVDCTFVALALAIIVTFLTGWWPSFCFVPVFYYIFYGIEYVIRYIYSWFKFRHLVVTLSDYAYKMVSFEQHAYELEKEWRLPIEIRKSISSFGWIKYLFQF